VGETLEKKRILFICTHNSARSQIAEGLLKHLYGHRYEVQSAGTAPQRINPYAIEVMAELGLDISKHRSKHVDEFKERRFDLAVTVCGKAQETCPFFPAKKVVHHSFPDPSSVTGGKDQKLFAFRKTRDDILEWIKSSLRFWK